MVAIDYLSFSFCEKLGFARLYKNFVNPIFKSVPRNILKRNLLKLYKKSRLKKLDVVDALMEGMAMSKGRN